MRDEARAHGLDFAVCYVRRHVAAAETLRRGKCGSFGVQ